MDNQIEIEKWKEVCYFLSQSISLTISEELFEQKVFQVLEKMGWSSYKGEIQPKQNIQIGSNNWIIPDIVVKSQDVNFQFVLEIKRPSVNIDDPSYRNQLTSYMRMLKCDYGLLIGSKVKIYYDGYLSNNAEPILLTQFQFDLEEKEGPRFIQLFSKDSYSASQLQIFTQSMIDKIKDDHDYRKIMDLIVNNEYSEKVKLMIGMDLSESYNENIVDKVLEDIHVQINKCLASNINQSSTKTESKNLIQHFQKKGVFYEFHPSNEDEFKRLLILRKQAFIKIFYNNDNTSMHIWNALYFKNSSTLRGNIDSKTWFRKDYVAKNGVFKAIFSIEPIS